MKLHGNTSWAWLWIFTWILSAPLSAEEVYSKKLVFSDKISQAGEKFFEPKLFLIDDDTLVQKTGIDFLPQRVYTIFLKEKKTWFFTLTTKRGKMTEPLEIIFFNTVLPGKHLGAKNPYQKYRFTKEWAWKPTKREEEYFSWVLSNPQEFKRTMFLNPPDMPTGANR